MITIYTIIEESNKLFVTVMTIHYCFSFFIEGKRINTHLFKFPLF